MEHYLYILYSPEHDKYYVGETSNYQQRLYQHNHTERNTFTSKYRPWELVAVFRAPDSTYAKLCERFIKRQKSKIFIKQLIGAEKLTGKLAQLVRVPNFRD